MMRRAAHCITIMLLASRMLSSATIRIARTRAGSSPHPSVLRLPAAAT